MEVLSRCWPVPAVLQRRIPGKIRARSAGAIRQQQILAHVVDGGHVIVMLADVRGLHRERIAELALQAEVPLIGDRGPVVRIGGMQPHARRSRRPAPELTFCDRACRRSSPERREALVESDLVRWEWRPDCSSRPTAPTRSTFHGALVARRLYSPVPSWKLEREKAARITVFSIDAVSQRPDEAGNWRCRCTGCTARGCCHSAPRA